ncbi:unnamed protein product, partial [Mesorhabditis spiculigera]
MEADGPKSKPPVRGKTSPYGFFVKMCYEEHKKKYPNDKVEVTEIAKRCSEKWKTMSEEEKRRFYELAHKDSDRYHAEVAAYAEEDQSRKRKRAKRDPNAPKRPLSAFFLFSQERRPQVVAEHPIAKTLGGVWGTMGPEDREPYDQRAQNDKRRYELEMAEYNRTRAQSPNVDVVHNYRAGPPLKQQQNLHQILTPSL